MQRDDNLISENLLSLLRNPQKNSEGLYEIPISALPLEPVLDPAFGFIGFPQAEVFKLDSKAKHDAVFGYDFFNFHGKNLFLDAQKWHIIYEEFSMARLKAEMTVRPRMQTKFSEITANIYSMGVTGGTIPFRRLYQSLQTTDSKAVRKDSRDVPYRT